MAITTNRFNIKPILFSIAEIVVVFPCLLGAVCALQTIRTGQFARSYSVVNSILSGNLLFALYSLAIPHSGCGKSFFAFSALGVPFIPELALRTLGVSAIVKFASLGLVVGFAFQALARFTPRVKAVFSAFIVSKLGSLSNLFAMRTTFCWDGFSHFRFLYKRLWKKLCALPTRAFSLYCIVPEQ